MLLSKNTDSHAASTHGLSIFYTRTPYNFLGFVKPKNLDKQFNSALKSNEINKTN